MIFKKKININDFLFFIILNLIYIKLIFSYLMVDLGWWLRDFTPNFEAYNFFNLPQNFSRNIEFVLIPFLTIYILINFKRLGYFKRIVEISLLLIALNVLTAIHNSKGLLESLELSLKLLSPLMFYLVLFVHFEFKRLDIMKTAFGFVKFCLLLTVIALLFFDPSSNRGPQRFLPIYFESIHAHSYILACVFVIWSYKYYKERKVKTLLLFIALSILFLWFGYAVRTAILVYLIYILILLFNVHNFFKYLWIKALVFLPIALLIFNVLYVDFDLDEYSSGRLSMYSEKIEQIKSFSFTDIILGQGHGSDLILSDIWSFGLKGSHSDILTYFVENGILFMLIYFILLMYLFFYKRKANSIYLSLIIGYFISSLISNGVSTRPLVGYVFFVALAFVALYDKNINRHNLDEG